MPTIPLYFHHMLTLGDRFDRPDAPVAALPDFTPQIVFKLFIEIPADPSATDAPFVILASRARDWAVREFASADIMANPGFLSSLLTFEKLTSFLSDSADPFVFSVLPASKLTSQSTSLAPFPMLPFVRLTPPAPAPAVDFATNKPCSADYLDSLTDPFAAPDSHSAPPAVPVSFPSLAAGIFTDYFVTVIRHLMDQPDPAAAAKAAALFLMHSVRLPDPDAPGAGDYPLYVLSGQQLPLPPDTSKAQANQYDQYAGYTVKLATSAVAKVGVSFPETGGEFSFPTLPAKIASLLGDASLATPFVPGDRIVALAQSEPFAVVPRRFALSDPVVWDASKIYALPQLLRDHLTATPIPATGGLDLGLLLRGATGTSAPIPATSYLWATRINFTIRQIADPSAAGQSLPTIYQIAAMDTDSRDDLLSFLVSPQASAGLYQISLLYADPTSSDRGLKSDAVQESQVWLVKSDLSTQAHTASDPASSSADLPGPFPGASDPNVAGYAAKANEFLTLLWEASLVSNGGFYLFYGLGTGLPASLFGQTGIATVTVMIVPQPAKIAARPFHNCVVCGSGDDAAFIDPPTYTVAAGDTLTAIAAKLNVTVEALLSANATNAQLLAPGTTISASSGTKPYAVQQYDNPLSLALRYESQPLGTQTLPTLWTALLAALPDGVLRQDSNVQIPGWAAARLTITPGAFGVRAVAAPASNALQKLYSFLGTEIRGLGTTLPGRLAASPQTSGPGATGMNPFYRQILFLADSNPYSRIGQTATLALHYQDVFGNRCLPSANALEMQFHIQYRDPLIGLTQWPGTSVSFHFGSGPQIAFTLAFETSRYLSGNGVSLDTVLTRAANDLQRYNNIASQIGQPGIAFQVRSSLSGAPAASIDLLNACRTHVDAVRAFLNLVLELRKKTSAVTHSDLASLAAANKVSVKDLATVNQDVPSLLGGPLRQLVIPVQYAINRNETLSGIAIRHDISVEDLASANQDVANLFLSSLTIPLFRTAGQTDTLSRIAASTGIQLETMIEENSSLSFGVNDVLPAGTQIRIGETAYNPAPTDTPSSIAIAKNITVSQLFAANRDNPILQPGTVIATGQTTYALQPGDTFHSVASGRRVTVALLATANQNQAILNTSDPGIHIEIPVAPVLPVFAVVSPVGLAVSPTITSTVTPISISIVIARPAGSVDQLFSDPAQFAAVQAVESEIQPDASVGGNIDALRAFGGQFESAFAAFNLKLALGPDHAGTALASSAKRLYAIRIEDSAPLFQIAAQPLFYATPPLLNTGWTGTVTSATGATVTFANVDLDAWAREFVATLDLLLSPAYAAALHASGNSATYHALASAKATIAGAMSLSVTPIFDAAEAATPDLAAARDALLGRVLVQLQEFYKVDAIVQFAVTTAYKGNAEAGGVAARLSGSLSGRAVMPPGNAAVQAKPEFTLSDATIDLGKVASELTFSLHLASSSQFPDLRLSLQFDPAALELASAFQGAQLAPGYESFDQLVLLSSPVSAASMPFATVDIPVPLRAYPTPPSLISQEVVQNLPVNPTLADLKTFEYQFRFNYATAGQDRLQIGLTTLPSAASDTATGAAPPATTVDNLPQALAQWALFAAGQSAALEGLLGATPDPDSLAAAGIFASVAGTIAKAWSARTPQLAQPPAPPLPDASTVTQDNPAAPEEHLVTVTSIAPPDPLNVIRVQSIRGSLHVTRNGTLAGAAVSPAFVYQVPTVQFTTPVVPLFRDDNPIDIAALPARAFVTIQDLLHKQIATLIANLLDANTATPNANLPNLRIAISFEFALATASGSQAALPELLTRTPVALLPRFAFDPASDFLDENGVCARVARELLSWHTREASSAGTWVFDVSVYSNVGEDSIQPLLELTNLRAPAGA